MVTSDGSAVRCTRRHPEDRLTKEGSGQKGPNMEGNSEEEDSCVHI
jgi:hypothetical protein